MLRSTIFFSLMAVCIASQAQQLGSALLVQVHGTVSDINSDQLLQASIYVLAPDTANELAITDTNTEGHYGLALQRGASYDIKVELEGYEVFEHRLDLAGESIKQVEFNIRMKRPIAVPADR